MVDWSCVLVCVYGLCCSLFLSLCCFAETKKMKARTRPFSVTCRVGTYNGPFVFSLRAAVFYCLLHTPLIFCISSLLREFYYYTIYIYIYSTLLLIILTVGDKAIEFKRLIHSFQKYYYYLSTVNKELKTETTCK